MPNNARNSKNFGRLSCEPLEDRCVPAVLFGLTTTNVLVTFDSTTPGTITTVGSITNLTGADAVVGIDVRPSTGQLYGLGFNFASVGTGAQLYTINPATAVATPVGSRFPMPNAIGSTLNAATSFGFDFNPVLDKIRVVSTGRDNFRLDPTTGAASTDTILTPAGSIAVGAAYTNNFAGATSTTLYDIDTSTSPDRLVIQGGNPVPPGASPGGGVLTVVGPLTVDSSNEVGFDIGADGTAYAALQVGGSSGLYTVNLGTGAAALVGSFGGVTLRDISVAPAGTIAFASATYSVGEAGPTATIALARTGGTNGAVSVTVNAVSGGTATAGSDFTDGPYTATFADGAATTTFTIPITNNTTVEPAETVSLVLTAPTGGAVLGTQTTATLTITDNDSSQTNPVAVGPDVTFTMNGAAKTITPFTGFSGIVTTASGDVNNDGVADVIVGAGVNGHVKVFDGATGAEIRSFLAYAGFPGGVFVGAGDVNGDNRVDIVTGAEANGHVKVFSGVDNAEIRSFLAFPGFTGSARVAARDMNGDSAADIVVGTGPGASPARVRTFDGRTLAVLSDVTQNDPLNLGVFVA